MARALRLLLAPVVVLVLAADYAALDDITTGNQPSFALEWAWLAVSTALLAVMGMWLVRRSRIGRRAPHLR